MRLAASDFAGRKLWLGAETSVLVEPRTRPSSGKSRAPVLVASRRAVRPPYNPVNQVNA